MTQKLSSEDFFKDQLNQLKEHFKKEIIYHKKIAIFNEEKVDFINRKGTTLEDYHKKYLGKKVKR